MKRCDIVFDTLLDVFEGRADSKTTERVRAHLAQGCENCRTQLAWIEQFIPALHHAVTEEEPQVSATALLAARNIARERQAARLKTPLLARIAQLLFDNRQAMMPAGARGGGRATQMLYATDEHFIDLWLERKQKGDWYMIGLALPRSGGEAITPDRVVLSDRDSNPLIAEFEASEFHLPSVLAGTYQLQVQVGDIEITVPDIAIGA